MEYSPFDDAKVDLKILVKILADHLQTLLSSLIAPKQSRSVKTYAILDNFHLFRDIIKKLTVMQRWLFYISSRPLISLNMIYWRLVCLQLDSEQISASRYAFCMCTPV